MVATQSDRSEISHVVLDGPSGNTWEQLAMQYCEHSAKVHSYAKNDHLGFSIPYVHEGRTHDYVPDFLVRLRAREDDIVRTLIVEISGSQKSAYTPGLPQVKAATARDSWCAAVNNQGQFGRWGYVEIDDPVRMADDLDAAIDALYADLPIIGDPDLLDLPRS